MTWHDIKLATLQKMFSADGENIPTDSSVVDYIASMPQAANEALQMLATAGKFIVKKIEINHNPTDNSVLKRYDLRDYAEDFYQFGDNQIFYESLDGKTYHQVNQYQKESDNVLVFQNMEPGIYTIYYRAYPVEISAWDMRR